MTDASTPGRNKKMVSYTLDPNLLEGMDWWIIKQDVPPSKTAVIEAALQEFLESRGWLAELEERRQADR